MRLTTTRCGGRLRVVEVVSQPADIAGVLHGRVARAPPPELLGQLVLDFAGLNSGGGLDDAIVQSVVLRMRPILLTTATTTAGLVPLALSSSSLWPPMAFAMISGLLASTLLTLGVVPALYRLSFARRGAELEARLPSAARPG